MKNITETMREELKGHLNPINCTVRINKGAMHFKNNTTGKEVKREWTVGRLAAIYVMKPDEYSLMVKEMMKELYFDEIDKAYNELFTVKGA